MSSMKLLPLAIIVAIMLPGTVIATEGTLEEAISSSSLNAVMVGGALAAILIALSLARREMAEHHKTILFVGIITPVILVTAYLVGATLFLNFSSSTGGPVHWHADFEIWNCGSPVDLKDPEGLLNRIGTPVYHEHGDNRIHVEGVVVEPEEVRLQRFFDVIGGSLVEGRLLVPLNQGELVMQDGMECNGQQGTLQVFVYQITNPDPTKRSGFFYTQKKVENYPHYILSPYTNVPPGDCIILEFDQEKPTTDKICETYRIAQERGELNPA